MASDFRIVIRSVDRALRCRAWLGDRPPMPSGGGGGHELVDLPGRKPVLVWRRGDLVVLTVPILIDAYADGEAVAGEYNDLIRMWRPLAPTDEPPAVRVEADGDSVPFSHLTWRMTGLEWGDAVANEHGNRTRQAFTVTLTEDNPEQRIEAQTSGSGAKRRADKRKKGKGSARPATHTVAAGETLEGIGAVVGLSWQQIGSAQTPPIRDPRELKVGQVLSIPDGYSPEYLTRLKMYAARQAASS